MAEAIPDDAKRQGGYVLPRHIAGVARHWKLILVGLVACGYLAAVLFAAVTHQPLADFGPAVTAKSEITGKRYIPGHEDCSPSSCKYISPDWQFDILKGNRANTIDVSEGTYNSYRVGDTYANH